MKVEVPLEFLHFFRDQPDLSVLEYLSMPSSSVSPFFRSRTKIQEAIERSCGRINPLNEDTYQFVDGFCAHDTEPRYMHIDLAINRDAAGVSMCSAPYAITRSVVMRDTGMMGSVDVPYIRFDFVGRLKPRIEYAENEINFSAIQELIYHLAYDLKFNLFGGLITFDRFQSHQLMSNVRAMGIPATLLSVDKTTGKLFVDFEAPHYVRRESVPQEPSAAMGALRDAAYQDRLEIPILPTTDGIGRSWLEREAEECEWDAKNQVARKMHGGSDDVLQSVAGAVYNCSNNANPGSAKSLAEADEELEAGSTGEEAFYDRIGAHRDHEEMIDTSIPGNTQGARDGFDSDQRRAEYDMLRGY